MKKILTALIFFSLAYAFIGPGCYTVIIHPKSDQDYRASQVSDCTRCHTDYGEYPYGHYYAPDPPYWWNFPRYTSYYADPWWWDHYNYPYLDGQVSRRDTKFDRDDGSDSPPPPPYAIPYTRDYPDRPAVITPSTDYQDIGDQGNQSQGRPGTGQTTTESRSKDSQSTPAAEKNVRKETPTKTTPSAPAERPSPKVTPEQKTPEEKVEPKAADQETESEEGESKRNPEPEEKK